MSGFTGLKDYIRQLEEKERKEKEEYLRRVDIQDLSLVDGLQKIGYPPGWELVFQESKRDLEDVSKILQEQGEFYPLKADLFRAYHMVKPEDVRVVILGQDPYHSNGSFGPTAMGMSFSVRRGDSIPPSLRNIFLELKQEIPEFKIPSHGDLSSWSSQGVMLLNACLTVRPGEAGSHGKIWNFLLENTMNHIAKFHPNCIYLLWGLPAQKHKEHIPRRSVILEAAHPSPLSASKGFFGCGHFKKVNEILRERGEMSIDWNL